MSSGSVLHASWLGRMDYLDAWRSREAVAARVRAGAAPHLLLLEHDPVYTIGSGAGGQLDATMSEIRAFGGPLYDVERDGRLAYHGPGQIVGYPIVRLHDDVDPQEYVHALEDGLIAAVLQYGIGSLRKVGEHGVWVVMPDHSYVQLGSVFTAMSEGISMHTVTLNVATDLDAARRAVAPDGHDITSFHTVGIPAPVRAVATSCGEAIAEALGGTVEWCDVRAPSDDEIPADAGVRSPIDVLAHEVDR